MRIAAALALLALLAFFFWSKPRSRAKTTRQTPSPARTTQPPRAVEAPPAAQQRTAPRSPGAATVTDIAGRPIPQAEVAVSNGPLTYAGFAFIGKTNDGGAVAVDPGGTHPLPYYRVTAEGFRTVWGEIPRERLLREGLVVELEPLLTVVGRLIDEAGDSLAGVHVTVRETMKRARSGEDGRFELRALPEDGGTLMIFPRDHGRRSIPDIVPRGEVTDHGDIVLDAGLMIAGRVVTEDDATPVVTCYCERTQLSTGRPRVDDDGNFEITGLEAGPHKVLAFSGAPSEPGKSDPKASAIVQAGTHNVILRLRRHPELEIRLPVPVLRIDVMVTPRDGGDALSHTVESPRMRRTDRTSLTLPEPGAYDVVVSTEAHEAQHYEIEIKKDERKVLTVEVR